MLVSILYFTQVLSGFLLASSACSDFFSAFHWSSSIDKPRLSPVSFVRTMESYEVSPTNLVHIKTTELYLFVDVSFEDSDWVSIWVVQ